MRRILADAQVSADSDHRVTPLKSSRREAGETPRRILENANFRVIAETIARL